MSSSDTASFAPPGWVTNRQAAEMMGVTLESMTQSNWKYRPMLRGTGRRVPHPVKGLTFIYPIDVVERIRAAQAADAAPEPVPDGFVDKDGACAFFGVERYTWKAWVNQGKVRCGRIVPARCGGKRTLYALADLERLKAELFDESRVFKRADQTWNVPADYLSREDACAKFGVSLAVWWRWERERKITCGERVPGGPKFYKPEDIYRLLDEYGTFCPPYPDPEIAGAYHVPLSGRDIKRREALVDADALPLIEGGSLSFAPHEDGASGCVMLNSDRHRSVPLRRVILGVTDPALCVRHANRDPLDCRRENLLVKTRMQKARNNRKCKSLRGQATTSRFKGVYWHADGREWRACIHFKGRKRSLGRYQDEIAAAQAYDEAARQWFGDDAWLNFPQGVDAWLEAEGFTSPSRAAA